MEWQDLVREGVRAVTGGMWQACIIPGLEVMDLHDGAWLRLEERMLQLFPGTSAREPIIWFKRTPVEEIVAALVK